MRDAGLWVCLVLRGALDGWMDGWMRDDRRRADRLTGSGSWFGMGGRVDMAGCVGVFLSSRGVVGLERGRYTGCLQCYLVQGMNA